MFNAVGGSTIHWSAHFPRYHPSDFRVRSLDGDGDDWPLSYDELEPFYDLNDRMIGIAGRSGDPSQPPRSRSPDAADPARAARRGDGARASTGSTGTGGRPIPPSSRRRSANGRPATTAAPATSAARPARARSADVTYWPLALRLGVELRTRCRVREITVDEQGRARGVLYYDESGSLQEQRAPLVIVAANGVGTPRLLLNSRSRAFPDGLANRAGMVGKCLMFHPFATASGILPDAVESYQGPIGCSIFSHEFYETDEARGFIRGFMMQIVRETGPLNEALGGATATRVPWGSGHHAAFAGAVRARRQHGADGRRPARDGERGDARPDPDGQRRHPVARWCGTA